MGNKVSSLHSASVSGDIERMRRCVEFGANPNDPRIAPLHAAALYGRVDILTFLLDAGGNMHVLAPMTESLFPGSKILANPFPHGRFTPLGCAILANNAACVELLLNRGASPNTVAGENVPAPLAIAIGSCASSDILKQLVDAGAAVRHDEHTDYVFMAAMFGNIGALDVLRELGVTTDSVRLIDAVLDKAEANADIPVHETMAWLLRHGDSGAALPTASLLTVPNLFHRLVRIGDRRLFDVVVDSLRTAFALQE